MSNSLLQRPARPWLKDSPKSRFVIRWTLVSVTILGAGLLSGAGIYLECGACNELVTLLGTLGLQFSTLIFVSAIAISELGLVPGLVTKMLSARDLDAVVDYAHRLGVNRQARDRVHQEGDQLLTYRRIHDLLEWMEAQGRQKASPSEGRR